MPQNSRISWPVRLVAVACVIVSTGGVAAARAAQDAGASAGDQDVVAALSSEGTGAEVAAPGTRSSREGDPAPAAPPASAVRLPEVTAPPTPTTAPPPAPTTAPPPPPTTAAPAPPPPPPTAPPPPPRALTLQERFDAIIPAAWRAALPVRIETIPGTTSWGKQGLIQISQSHATGSTDLLDVVLAHEFGHVIAFRYGSGAYLGAAPAGWPPATLNPAEHWADCVQQVFLGTVRPSHGLPGCAGAQLDWARNWLAAGPP